MKLPAMVGTKLRDPEAFVLARTAPVRKGRMKRVPGSKPDGGSAVEDVREARSADLQCGHQGRHGNQQASTKGTCEKSVAVEPHKCRHISHFLNVTFNYVAKMHVPDLGDMATANWIVDWDKPDPAQGGIAEYRRVRERIGDEICTELPANRGTGSEN